MPFDWQTTGALRGGVPNQMGSFTPQNNEGLATPWGQAMFNLPRFQMPGSTVNFGGGFNLGGDMSSPMGQPQTGMAPGANVGNVRFSLSRQASSDPVQNVINDIQNPLGGMSLGFSNGNAAPAQPMSPLKQSMTGVPAPSANPFGQGEPMTGFGIGTPNFANMARPDLTSQQEGFTIGTPNFQAIARSPFSLKSQMLSQPIFG